MENGVVGRRRVRPRTEDWERELAHLTAIHARGLAVPVHELLAAADRLGVSERAVSDRLGERARHIARRERPLPHTDAIAAVVDAADFQAAARQLADRGMRPSSFTVERLLRSAPGPEASRLRVREMARRASLSDAQGPRGLAR